MWTDIKVNLIIWWREHGDDVLEALFKLTFILWLPIVVVLMVLTPDEELTGDDKLWCLSNGYSYDKNTLHSEVKQWKKEKRKRDKETLKRKLEQEAALKKERKSQKYLLCT